MNDLKLCPFCGDFARIYIDCGVDRFYSFKAVCWRETCHAQTPFHRSSEEATEAWNKRI